MHRIRASASSAAAGQQCSKEQRQLMLDILEEQKEQIRGRFDGTRVTHETVDGVWQRVALECNSLQAVTGIGARKTSDQWKDSFTDWKSRCKGKIAAWRETCSSTGGGPPPDVDSKDNKFIKKVINKKGKAVEIKEPTKLEYRALPFITEVALEGLPNVPDCGFGAPNFQREKLLAVKARRGALPSSLPHTVTSNEDISEDEFDVAAGNDCQSAAAGGPIFVINIEDVMSDEEDMVEPEHVAPTSMSKKDKNFIGCSGTQNIPSSSHEGSVERTLQTFLNKMSGGRRTLKRAASPAALPCEGSHCDQGADVPPPAKKSADVSPMKILPTRLVHYDDSDLQSISSDEEFEDKKKNKTKEGVEVVSKSPTAPRVPPPRNGKSTEVVEAMKKANSKMIGVETEKMSLLKQQLENQQARNVILEKHASALERIASTLEDMYLQTLAKQI